MAPGSSAPYPRHLSARLRRDLGIYPAVTLLGARQVGKTTLARRLGTELGMAYRSLDERDVRVQAIEDPEGLVASVAATGAVFDEVQRAPQLLLAIKAVVDREQRPGRFLLTGSSQPRLAEGVADSLVGRVAYRTLRPLTLAEQRYDDEPSPRWGWLFDPPEGGLERGLGEWAELNAGLDWRAAAATGGMPRAIAAPPEDRLQVLDDYLRVFAQRDIRDVLAVDDPERLDRFARLVAAWTARELNASSLGRDLGLATTTVRRWLDGLERSYLVHRVPAWSRNTAQRVIHAPKLFFVDAALALAATGEEAPTGLHFETLLANELLIWRDHAPRRDLHHWRIASGPEVDFVLRDGTRAVAVELKGAARVGRADARHLATFLDRYSDARLGVLVSA
ncbi:MAG TPA: ATP-binding protein, partial [Gemmatirosa sp.]